MPFSRTAGAMFASLIALVPAPATAADIEIDDLPRTTGTFSYYQLGRHVPPRSGWANYIGGRTVIHPSIRLPLEIDPKQNEHMYCNTQVWGFKDNGRPTGKGNHLNNYTFPWTSTFCEKRNFPGVNQPTFRCGRDRRGRPLQSHQGSDCRPPAPKADHYWMVAVEDGTVTEARRNLVTLVGVSGIKWKYRHGGTPRREIVPGRRGVFVTRGTRLAKVTDLGSTPIHLHLESERPAGSDRDNMPSLILAYQRASDLPETPILASGELELDARYEIPEGTVVEPCAASEGFASIGTDQQYAFKSLWCHNRSIMGLVEDGERRQFVYLKPKPGIRAAAMRNPVLFDGTLGGDKYDGQGLWFNERCGDRQFAASGSEVSSGGVRVVTLRGKRPSFRGGCSTPAFVDETMAFSFMRPTETEVASESGGDSRIDGAGTTHTGEASGNEPTETRSADSTGSEQTIVVTGPCAEAWRKPSIGTEERFNFKSLWCHNHSVMGLVDDNTSRKLVYYKPKESVRESALRDAILFDGTLQSGHYRGKGLWFNARCGDQRFDVTGSVSETGGIRTISLNGKRPSFSRGCSRRRFLDETMTFALLHDLASEETSSGGTSSEEPGDETAEEVHDGPDEPLTVASCEAAESQAAVKTRERFELTSLWCHNGSIMGLAKDADATKLVYYKPRAGIGLSAARDPVLFDGAESNGSYTGKGLWFSQRCGDHRFDVTGRLTTAGGVPIIALQGNRPSFEQGCNQPQHVSERMVFSFLRTAEVTMEPTEDNGTQPDGSGGTIIGADGFDLEAPANIGRLERFRLWSTQYYVEHGPDSDHTDAVGLRTTSGTHHGVKLRSKTFCHAAVEGTVRVDLAATNARSFNWAGTRRPSQTNCNRFMSARFGGPASKARWLELGPDSPFGLGNHHHIRLVPFRSIAADQRGTRLKRGTVLFIPDLRGLTFTLAGQELTHDGYVYVADVGGAIKGSHIDFFSGLKGPNPFPSLIRSRSSAKFDAYMVTDRGIRRELHELHDRSTRVASD